jgi:hypothetical protein
MPERLVALAHGPAEQVRGLVQQAAPVLAAALALPWVGCLDASEPPLALADLSPGLAALPIDPGQGLVAGGHWAEALGAWRQPALVLFTAEQAGWGLAAASAALLAQQQVPLAGLVQWGGPWPAEHRRRDGLPWLGWLADQFGGRELPNSDEPAAAQVAEALRLRWARLAGDQG